MSRPFLIGARGHLLNAKPPREEVLPQMEIRCTQIRRAERTVHRGTQRRERFDSRMDRKARGARKLKPPCLCCSLPEGQQNKEALCPAAREAAVHRRNLTHRV